jgi:diketogulonate reductase-like aldo/keto reductase
MNLTINSTVRLNNGVLMPRFGLGVYRIPPGKPTLDAVHWALDAGYRLIDTAKAYGNEASVGQAVRESSLPREEIFVTTKLWNAEQGYDSTLKAFTESLRTLGLDYIDLYLVHWPVEGRRLDTWRAMEEIARNGRCRAVGVSNYMTHHLLEVLNNGTIPPAVNQIELHPWNYSTRKEVVESCKIPAIAMEAYSPLARSKKFDDPELVRLARKLGRTPAQVLIRWCLQRGFITIPKSAQRERILENAQVFDFVLQPEEMDTLEALNYNLATGWDPWQAP